MIKPKEQRYLLTHAQHKDSQNQNAKVVSETYFSGEIVLSL